MICSLLARNEPIDLVRFPCISSYIRQLHKYLHGIWIRTCLSARLSLAFLWKKKMHSWNDISKNVCGKLLYFLYISLLKKPSPIASDFSNFLRFWYQKKKPGKKLIFFSLLLVNFIAGKVPFGRYFWKCDFSYGNLTITIIKLTQ